MEACNGAANEYELQLNYFETIVQRCVITTSSHYYTLQCISGRSSRRVAPDCFSVCAPVLRAVARRPSVAVARTGRSGCWTFANCFAWWSETPVVSGGSSLNSEKQDDGLFSTLKPPPLFSCSSFCSMNPFGAQPCLLTECLHNNQKGGWMAHLGLQTQEWRWNVCSVCLSRASLPFFSWRGGIWLFIRQIYGECFTSDGRIRPIGSPSVNTYKRWCSPALSLNTEGRDW